MDFPRGNRLREKETNQENIMEEVIGENNGPKGEVRSRFNDNGASDPSNMRMGESPARRLTLHVGLRLKEEFHNVESGAFLPENYEWTVSLIPRTTGLKFYTNKFTNYLWPPFSAGDIVALAEHRKRFKAMHKVLLNCRGTFEEVMHCVGCFEEAYGREAFKTIVESAWVGGGYHCVAQSYADDYVKVLHVWNAGRCLLDLEWNVWEVTCDCIVVY